MSVPKSNRTSSVTVPINNINTYVRVPGYPPYPLGRALQEWDGVEAEARWHKDTDGNDSRLVREIVFQTQTAEGGVAYHKVVVNEQIFEVALYTRATRRFTLWMKANKEAVKAGA